MASDWPPESCCGTFPLILWSVKDGATMRSACLILLLSISATAQVKATSGVAIILGRVQSANIKYFGLGKQTARSYRGVVQVKVVRVLDRISLGSSVALRRGDIVPVHIEETNKKPNWELRTGHIYVLGVEPLTAGGLRPLFVIAAEISPDQPAGGFAECVEKVGFSHDESGTPIWLDSAQMHARAIQSHLVETPGLMDGQAKGQVTLVVLVRETGMVECAQVVEGHPIAFASAIDAATKYRFRPYSVNGRNSPVLGTLTLDFDFRRGER
jgi:hypothetical protein